MNQINVNINEDNNLEVKALKKQNKKNSNLSSDNKLLKESQNLLVSKNKSKINKKNTKNYTSNLYKKNINECESINNSLNNLANKIISKNKTENISLQEKILLELFINISEFNESNFDFFVSYQNLCNMLNNKGLLNKELNKNVIITKTDLDIKLKEILTNKNLSKKLNFNNFVKFLAYLAYKIDTIHFIDNPRRTFNYIINKYFNNNYYYYNDEKDKNSLIRIIYSYILTIQEEKNINYILEDIIIFLSQIYINYFFNELNNINNKDSVDIDKNNFKCIVLALKNIGIYPILINIKELVIMFYILLDDTNDNIYLDIKDININNDFKFKKFCQFFITLCLFIKEKNYIVLRQYSYLLNKKKEDENFDNILKNGQKEGIVKFILQLNIENKYKYQNIYFNDYNINNDDINKEKEQKNLFNNFNLNHEEIDFIKQIFESYSSYLDKNFNYQLSFTDIIIFLKDYNLIVKNNNYPNLLKEKVLKAQVNSRNNIKKLKRSLHSLDHLFNNKKYIKIKDYNYNSYYNKISLGDLELLFSKTQQKDKKNININKSMDDIFFNKNNNKNNYKDYNLKIRLNLEQFIYFLNFLSNKLFFESLSDFIKYLSKNIKYINTHKFQSRDMNLRFIYRKYKELDSSELLDIIQEFSPILNIYFNLYIRKSNLNGISFNYYLKLFSDFEIFPKIVNHNLLKNIFCVLYQINNNSNEEININEDSKEINIIQKNKEIGFNEFILTFGIISLYITEFWEINEIQSLLALFYLIINSDKIKSLKRENNFNFIQNIKDKVNEINERYNYFKKDDEPEFIKYLKEPYF